MKAKPKLTPKQARFCSEYIVDLNGTQAAIRAGYSPNAANEIAAALLAKTSIQSSVSELQEDREKRTQITQDKVLSAHATIAFLDVKKAFDENGVLLPANKLPPEVSRAVSAIETVDGKLTKLRFADRGKSLEMLGRHLGMDRRELQISGGDDRPVLNVIIRSVLDKPPGDTSGRPVPAERQIPAANKSIIDLLPAIDEGTVN